MSPPVAGGSDASDLEPRNVRDLDRSIDGRIVVDVVSYIAGGSVSGSSSRDATVPRHIQCRSRLDSDDTSFNTQSA
jgi:hypothetical protein